METACVNVTRPFKEFMSIEIYKYLIYFGWKQRALKTIIVLMASCMQVATSQFTSGEFQKQLYSSLLHNALCLGIDQSETTAKFRANLI